MSQPFKNTHDHPPHGFLDVLKWKLGITPKDPASTTSSSSSSPSNISEKIKPDQIEPDLTSIHSPTPHSLHHSIQVTWIGHSSFLIQSEGLNILIDPVYAEFCSPLPLPSLRRLQPPGIPWKDLPAIDVVLITHNHYDHLDVNVVKKLADTAQFFVPEGLDVWMKCRGVKNVTALPWWKSASLTPTVRLTSCPAQHGSARNPRDRNCSHWCGWMLEMDQLKIYHAGDTGYCPHFQEIGKKFAPIDLALLPIGAYSPRALMRSVHVTPEESVKIHQDIQSRHSIACHWGTFRLTDEPVMEPLELLQKAKQAANLTNSDFHTLPIGGLLTLPKVPKAVPHGDTPSNES